jgi:hypothetical protein
MDKLYVAILDNQMSPLHGQTLCRVTEPRPPRMTQSDFGLAMSPFTTDNPRQRLADRRRCALG